MPNILTKRIIILPMFFLLIQISLWGQVMNRPPRFIHYDKNAGLSNSTVYSITQDALGFIWVGTTNGLNKYDNYQFQVFTKSEESTNSLSNSSAGNIKADRNGNLLIGTWGGGLNRYDIGTGRFTHYLHDKDDSNSISDNRVQAVFESSDGDIWAGTYSGGLNCIVAGSDKIEIYKNDNNDPNSISDNRVWDIAEDNSRHLWIATSYGLNRFSIGLQADKHFEVFLNKPGSRYRLCNNLVRTLYFDKAENRLWVGTQNGVSLIHLNNGKTETFFHDDAFKNFYSQNTINAILKARSGKIYIATGEGLIIFDYRTKQYNRYKYSPENSYSISDIDIRALFEDRSGIIWVGTRNNGLNKYNPNAKAFIALGENYPTGPPLKGKYILSMHLDESYKNKMLWIAEKQDLFRFDLNKDILEKIDKNTIPALLAGSPIRCIESDKNNADYLWMGVSGNIVHLNKRNFQAKQYFIPQFGKKRIRYSRVYSLLDNGDGTLWFGDYTGGLNLLNIKNNRIVQYIHDEADRSSISNNEILAILKLSPEKMWVGTGNGLNLFNIKQSTFKRIPLVSRQSKHYLRIFDLHLNSDTLLWVATDDGLIKYNPVKNTFLKYGYNVGFSDVKIMNIVEDHIGHLWLTTENGLVEFDPEEVRCVNYSKADGLQNIEFVSGAREVSKSGNIYIGGSNGVDYFNPDSIQTRSFQAPMVITKFSILNRPINNFSSNILKHSINFTKSIRLSYDDYLFSFEFSSLDYASSEKIRYAYQMEGIDKDWIYAGPNQRTATYTTLPGGDYIFRVKGSNSEGVWNPNSIAINVTIVPPFWKTFWFQISFVLVIIASIVGTLLKRTKNIRTRYKKLDLLNKNLKTQIEKRDAAEKALKVSENQYRALFNNLPTMYFNLNTDFELLSVNPFGALQLGYTQAELVGISGLYLYHEADRPKAKQFFKDCIAEVDQNRISQVRKIKNDGEYIWVNETARAIKTEQSELIIFLVSQDVTARKRVIEEKNLLEKQLFQAQKMEAIGTLAGGIAHDFNNMLTVINGRAELALMNMEKQSEAEIRADLEAISDAGAKAASLTGQLLAFGKKQVIQPTVLEINKLIRDNYDMLCRLIGTSISIKLKLKEQTKYISADPGQIEQLFINLMINARDAINENEDESAKKEIEIKTQYPGKFRDPLKKKQFNTDAYVTITVSDTGRGMKPEIVDKIFDPFFSTKDKSKGTGLGMAIVHGIIVQNNANIDIFSKYGKGTCIEINWPVVAEERLPELIIEKKSSTPDIPPLNILLIEDEKDVRNYTIKVLGSLGHSVEASENGIEGLEKFKKSSTHFDLVITDIVMPEMDGIQLLEKIRQINKNLKFILISGYNDHLQEIELMDSNHTMFLQKPFTLKELSEKIAELFSA